MKIARNGEGDQGVARNFRGCDQGCHQILGGGDQGCRYQGVNSDTEKKAHWGASSVTLGD